MNHYLPGTRVLVFDWRRYRDDVATPIDQTLCPATVQCWYGQETQHGRYDLIDVEFEDRPGAVSRGHITATVRIIATAQQAETAALEVTRNAKLSVQQTAGLRRKLMP